MEHSVFPVVPRSYHWQNDTLQDHTVYSKMPLRNLSHLSSIIIELTFVLWPMPLFFILNYDLHFFCNSFYEARQIYFRLMYHHLNCRNQVHQFKLKYFMYIIPSMKRILIFHERKNAMKCFLPQFWWRYGLKSSLLGRWKSAEKTNPCEEFDVANPCSILQQIFFGGLMLKNKNKDNQKISLPLINA